MLQFFVQFSKKATWIKQFNNAVLLLNIVSQKAFYDLIFKKKIKSDFKLFCNLLLDKFNLNLKYVNF